VLPRLRRRGARVGPMVAVATAAVGFVIAVSVQARPASPESRLPRSYQLAGLIERQQRSAAGLRVQVDELRREVDELLNAGAGRAQDASQRGAVVDNALLGAGLVAMRGPGTRVTLDDSSLKDAPSGNVNDLVIHSQDVQAVVNALWRAGAEAIAINDQRLVGTSAVLCVGNTLLLNGTVHSPPYVVSAVGADRAKFDADALVRDLKSAAAAFGLRITVTHETALDVPAFTGSTGARYARPVR
jgi:uncharacterized protein YlxW (UPF0749 family)